MLRTYTNGYDTSDLQKFFTTARVTTAEVFLFTLTPVVQEPSTSVLLHLHLHLHLASVSISISSHLISFPLHLLSILLASPVSTTLSSNFHRSLQNNKRTHKNSALRIHPSPYAESPKPRPCPSGDQTGTAMHMQREGRNH